MEQGDVLSPPVIRLGKDGYWRAVIRRCGDHVRCVGYVRIQETR